MTPEIDLSEFKIKTSRTCKVPELNLDQEQRAKLNAAFEEKSISTYAITQRLAKWDAPLAQNTVDKHRQKNCTCYRDEA